MIGNGKYRVITERIEQGGKITVTHLYTYSTC